MKGFLLLVSLCSLLVGVNAHGADVLDVDSAVKQGQVESPRLQKAQAIVDEARARKLGAWAGFLPKLQLNANHWFALKYQYLDLNFNGTPSTFAFIFPTSLVSLDATMPIFDGFNNVSRFGAASAGNEAAEDEARWALFQTEEEIRLRFYQALSAQRLQDVAKQNVKTLEDHLHQMKILRKGGVATNYDLLRVEVQLHEAQSEQLRAEDEMVVSRQRLAEVMGLEADERPLNGELPVPTADRVSALTPKDIAERGDLKALELRQLAAERNESAEAAFWVPRVNLAGSYLFYNNRNADLFQDYRSAYQLGVTLQWNLFDGLAGLGKKGEAVAQRAQAEKSLRIARLHVPRDFDVWKRRYLYGAAVYNTRVSDVAKAQESVRLGHEGFRAGVRTSTDLLDAELDLFRARAGVVTAETTAAEALINLELALGKKL